MVEPLTTSALIGAGAWFSNKLLGPSAEAIGGQLRLYASDRLKRVFARAEDLAASADGINPLPPSFVIKLGQGISMSEDTGELTDMWARLILDASRDFRSRHSVFASILSELSSEEAVFLSELVGHNDLPQNWLPALRAMTFGQFRSPASDIDDAFTQAHALSGYDFGFSVYIRYSQWCYKFGDTVKSVLAPLKQKISLSSLDVLVRQQLVQPFQLSQSYGEGWTLVEGVVPSFLGIELVEVCRS